MNVRRFQLYKLLLLAGLPPAISAPIANMAAQAEMPTVDKRYQEWQLWTQLDGELLFIGHYHSRSACQNIAKWARRTYPFLGDIFMTTNDDAF
jgi:hypothetical protein